QTGGTNVNVTGKTTATVNFTAPIIWAYEEPLTFRLNVNDGAGGTSSDEVVVTVRNPLAWPAYPVTYPATTSYLQNMLHLGANSTDRLMNPENWGNMTSGFDPLEPFGGVRNIRPYPGLEYDFTGMAPTANRNPLVWEPVFWNSGIFDNGALDYFQMHYNVYILSPEDRDVRWHVRNDDEVRVFCNGATVLSRNEWDGAATGTATEQTEDGYVADGTGLKKGINVITGWYEEGEGGAYFAVGVTDLNDERFDDLLYSFGPSLVLTDAYASRSLPTSFGPGATVNVDLAMKVNPTNKPTSVIVSENIPTGIPPANVSAPGATIGGGKITWNLTGANVTGQTLSYSLTVPAEGLTNVMQFVGTLTFGTMVADIFGENAMYPIPTAPRSLSVEMLRAAHLSWAAPATTGVIAYNVYRSVNGGAYELIGVATSTSYTDKWVVPGDTYAYEVSAVNQVNDEGPLSRPTAQVSVPTMEIRQAEDFNYDSGQFPWTDTVTLPAIEAPDATTIGTPDQYDYYPPATGGPGTRTYRPLDNRADGTGVGIEIAEDVDDPGVFHTNIGWIDAGTNSWYRYSFNVPQAGWVKFEFRVATPNAAGMIEAYWDEVLVGTVSFTTGNWHIMTWALMEDEIQTTAGIHTLRVKSVGDGINFDTIALLWNAAPPTRQSIWEDNFDSYAATADVFSPTGGKWTRGNTTNTAGSWTLWDTAGPPLNAEPANIAGMEGKYMISDSDLSGAGILLNEEMLSPEVDCTDWTNVRLNFNKNYRMYDDPSHQQIAEVDIRMFDAVSGWSNWTNLLHLDTSDVDPTADPPELSDPEVFDLSAYDGKKIQLKFHFYDAEYDYWFAVDNVRVSGVKPPQIPPGATIRLGPGAGMLTLSWTAFGPGQYSVEYTADLKGSWMQIAGPLSEATWSGAMPAGRTGYYRIRPE
ncbi:MAG: carbohydrate-binding protein, partial [bacterium]|nr:carbohydrate-binding protein [bacterium]